MPNADAKRDRVPFAATRRLLQNLGHRVGGTAKTKVRLSLMKAGRRVTASRLANLRSVLSYLELGHWLAHDFSNATVDVVADQFALFDRALAKVRGQRPLYLEFGVFEGRSMRWWSQHLPHPQARLIGFDSFEGLPQDWRPGLGAGHFDVGGEPPKIDDARVSFVVGWFDDSLPKFDVPEHDQLIINVDCDVYSSAATVLSWAEPLLQPGTLIYFDEFPDRDHEMRAFKELMARSPREFRPLATARGHHWLFEVVK
ncbi:class I SAM-dependent methyltransferase [Mycobacterium sp. E2497]|uniref:class I SAM-dependent methyltransferase n=1 Tax=Mycobacterium sp. E2497 TaxID=1834135 RepID=UPI0012EA9AA6|nr:class I SAM-dependent methyltransferase [Mycobacterium sp. E2497]